MSAPALRASHISVHRGARAIVDDVSFDLKLGHVTALIGPNGSGKTTLMKALVGLLPFAGEVWVTGQPLAELDRKQRAQRVAYVPQQTALDAPLPVRDVVAQGRLPHRGALTPLSLADRQAIEGALQATDTAQFGERPFTALSHGEKHRVLIARGLATQAPVLLLDEPTAGLDLAHVLDLLGLLKRLAREGRSILVVLHPLAEVASVADEVAVLRGGKLHAHGPRAQVLTPELVREVYQVLPIPGGAWGFEALGDAHLSSAPRTV